MSNAPQVQPPPIPPWFVPRPLLTARLEGVLRHKLTTVVAGPGYGKSTILAAWGLSMGCAWLTAGPGDASVSAFAGGLVQAFRRRLPALRPDLEAAVRAGGDGGDPAHAELLAGLVSEALEPILPADLPLVIDAAENLGSEGGSVRLLEALIRQAPAGLHLVLSSRERPPEALSRTEVKVLALGPAELALSLPETEALFLSTVGPIEPGRLQELHARTGGWPAAVRLVVERMQGRPESLRPDAEPGETFAALADQVLSREPPNVLELLSLMSPFERFPPDLCEALGVEEAGALLDSLAGRGLFVQYQGGTGTWLTVHALLREFAQDRRPRGDEETRTTLLRAADWFEGRGDIEDALAALERAGDHVRLAGFLERRGTDLLATGGVGRVVGAGRSVPAEARGEHLEMLLGWASRLRGDWEAAFEHYRRAAGDRELLPAPLAWRLVEAHYLSGELAEALDAARRADPADASPHDRALLMAWEASTHHRMGDNERARALARAAREIAEAAGDDEALAAAHTTEAMVVLLAGGNDTLRERHEVAAVEAAERAGSLHARVRILVNRSDHLANQGRFDEVREMTDIALRLAESTGDPYTVARVFDVRAQAALGQGRLAEAVNDAEAARRLYRRAGGHIAFEAILHLGHAHREAGELAAARAAFDEGLSIGERTGSVSVVQEALAGMSRLVSRDDPAGAVAMAERALAIEGGTQHSRTQAMLAAGWVLLLAGDRDRARDLAEQAARFALARERPRLPRLAESLELAAMTGSRPDLDTLERALDVWREVGNDVAIARVEFTLAALRTEPPDGTPSVGGALRRLSAVGVRPSSAAGSAGLLATLPARDAPPLEVRTLGGFAVLREGAPVPHAEWKSRKARDLLKILVARRGLPTHREYLMEALWPEESPDRLSNRLSVALAILRSVLDPRRQVDGQHFVTGEGDSVRLNLDRLTVDVEAFLAAGRQALGTPATTGEPLFELEAAEAMYPGDFLEEDPYEDWATHLREEAKSVYVELCRTLAVAAMRSGRHDAAVGYGLKILSRDPYDEVAHLLIVRALVASGRHGEARRRYRVYVSALEEIGVAPQPYPGSSGPGPTH